MTRDETKVIIGAMMASYPNYKPADLKMTVDTWTLMLEEYSYSEIQTALRTFISTDTSGFAPSIGQLIDQIHTVREMNHEENPMSAWDKVMDAIGNATYGANEEFEKLPDIAKQVLRSPSQLRMMATNEDFNEDVEKALFMKTYAEMQKKQKQINRMPSEVKQMIENKNEDKYLSMRVE